MRATKFGISIPTEVMKAVDRAARERGITRSRFIAEVLRRVARAKRDDEISRRIDEVLSDPALRRDQRSMAADYRRIQPRRGTEW
jgi:metal-responsive CopG/Arc/MetJ family transcriptional regulator